MHGLAQPFSGTNTDTNSPRYHSDASARVSFSGSSLDFVRERRKMIQRLPVLLCPYCQEQTVLPYRNFQGASGPKPYWPTDSETIALACHHCAHLSVHWERNIRILGVESEALGQPPSVLWRVEFSCSHPRCGLRIVVHTRTEDGLPQATVAGRAYNVTPKPECPAGHAEGAQIIAIQVVQ